MPLPQSFSIAEWWRARSLQVCVSSKRIGSVYCTLVWSAKLNPRKILLGVKFVTTPIIALTTSLGFPGGSDSKESACSAGHLSWIPGSGRSPGEGNGNPLLYSCLGNPMDGGAWRATVHRVAESDMTERLHFNFLDKVHYLL